MELRKTKAILITTHHMEEAEVLGDTISILSNGRLQLTGSPLELKHKVGSGYILKLCTNPSQFNEDECLELIREYIPSARIMVNYKFKSFPISCFLKSYFHLFYLERSSTYSFNKFTL